MGVGIAPPSKLTFGGQSAQRGERPRPEDMVLHDRDGSSQRAGQSDLAQLFREYVKSRQDPTDKLPSQASPSG